MSPRIGLVIGLWQCDKENHGWREGLPLTVAAKFRSLPSRQSQSRRKKEYCFPSATAGLSHRTLAGIKGLGAPQHPLGMGTRPQARSCQELVASVDYCGHDPRSCNCIWRGVLGRCRRRTDLRIAIHTRCDLHQGRCSWYQALIYQGVDLSGLWVQHQNLGGIAYDYNMVLKQSAHGLKGTMTLTKAGAPCTSRAAGRLRPRF